MSAETSLRRFGGVEVAAVAGALRAFGREIPGAGDNFGDGTGSWISVDHLVSRIGGGASYGPVRSCLDDLAREGRARRHPSGADFWQETETNG
jgi:hypothetical protein